ncbi:atherin-like [Balaenoptera ricei]|uniref:atherin-like n=1 Tax=Balaenoptera ricei TaxID=2746895 RepID=UPI0028BEE990|nr:atherin-like [Balaenoptera ricei]
MFGRTRPQVAPPPGENVQREAGTPAGPGPRAPLPGLQAALLRPPPPGPALLGAAPSRGRLAAAAPSRTFFAAAPPPRGDGEVKAAGARPGPLAGATRRPCALRQPGVAWGSPVLPAVLASSAGSRRGRPQPRPVSSPDRTAPCPATRPPRPSAVASPPLGERGQPEKISSENAAGTLKSR